MLTDQLGSMVNFCFCLGVPATLHCLVQVEQMRGSAEQAGLSAGDRVAAAEERLSQAQHALDEARCEHAELVQQRDAAAAAAASASAQVLPSNAAPLP